MMEVRCVALNSAILGIRGSISMGFLSFLFLNDLSPQVYDYLPWLEGSNLLIMMLRESEVRTKIVYTVDKLALHRRKLRLKGRILLSV